MIKIIISAWMIRRGVLQKPSRKVLTVLYPDDWFVKEVRQTVGSCLVLNDQPGGDFDQVWV